MPRCLLGLLFLLATPLLFAQPLESGDLLIASRQRPPFDGVPIDSAFAVYGPDGVLKRNLPAEWGFCRGLFVEESRSNIACARSSELITLDANGTLLDELLNGYEHLASVLITSDGTIIAAEQTAAVAPRLVVIRPGGAVVEYELPPASPVYSLGVMSMDLLPDRCTVVYTIGSHYAVDFRRVARFDICTGRALPDLFRLPESAILAGGIRVLPNGEILVATGYDIRRYDSVGQEKGIYYGPAQEIALTPDGGGFWAASGSKLLRFSLASPFSVGAPVTVQYSIEAIGVVNEFRAAAVQAGPRRRTARH